MGNLALDCPLLAVLFAYIAGNEPPPHDEPQSITHAKRQSATVKVFKLLLAIEVPLGKSRGFLAFNTGAAVMKALHKGLPADTFSVLEARLRGDLFFKRYGLSGLNEAMEKATEVFIY